LGEGSTSKVENYPKGGVFFLKFETFKNLPWLTPLVGIGTRVAFFEFLCSDPHYGAFKYLSSNRREKKRFSEVHLLRRKPKLTKKERDNLKHLIKELQK